MLHISDKLIRNVKRRIYSLPMNLHKLQLDLLQQHSESFNNWSAIIWINTECKSLIMKLVPGHLVMYEIGPRSFSDV